MAGSVLILLGAVIWGVGYILGRWGGEGGLSGPGYDPVRGSVVYVTEGGDRSGRGVVDSPLDIEVRMPVGEDGAPLFPVSATVQLLDAAGNPAPFGPGGGLGASENAISAGGGGMLLQPGPETGLWLHHGSVPSRPGTYHARLLMQVFPDDRQGTGTGSQAQSQLRVLDFPEATLQALPESGPPLRSGYVLTGYSNLWLLATDLSRRRRLTFFQSYYEVASQPAWSPDGTSIAFAYSPRVAQNEIPKTHIWAVNPDGGGLHRLVEHGPDEALYDPAWSPDGRYVYFTVEQDATSSTVYDASGSPVGQRRIDRLEIATGERTRWVGSGHMPSVDGLSGDVVYVEDIIRQDDSAGGALVDQQLVRARPDGSSQSVLVPPGTFMMMYAPHISPDGRWVVFAAINTPPQPQGATPTTGGVGGPGGLDLPGWLTFRPLVAHANGQPWDLYLVPASASASTPASAPVRLTRLDEDQPYPVWLDGSTIVFIGYRGMFRLSIDATGRVVQGPDRIYEGGMHSSMSWHAP